MYRCIELAQRGAGHVAPNPLVGAVLVHDNRIIGEGWHQRYGEAHAEVNCINSVNEEDKKLISSSTLYVSLEPCSHFGKTPPCTDLILRNNIPSVIIGCSDPFTEVNGKGIERLKAAGINVTTGILKKECVELNKRFFTFHTQHRPYIILKWAQTADNKIASNNNDRLLISNEQTNRIAHKWRSEEAAILIGTNTALMDDPSLTTRLWAGESPGRLIVDMDLRLPHSLKVFNQETRTIIFNSITHNTDSNPQYYQVTKDVNLVHQIVNALYQLNIQSVLVEGGAQLLQSFIDENIWDEARVITNRQLTIDKGLNAPELNNSSIANKDEVFSDQIEYFTPRHSGAA